MTTLTLPAPRTGGLRPSLDRLMLSAVPGSFAAVCLTPFVITAILQGQGASLLVLSLIPAVAQGAGFLGIPVALLTSSLAPKTAFLIPFGLSRLAFLLLLLPLLLGLRHPLLLLLAYALAKMLTGGSMGAMHTWLRAVIPTPIQPTYLGRRTAIGMVLIPLGTLAIGWTTGQGLSFTVVLAFGLTMAVMDLGLLGSVRAASPQESLGLAKACRLYGRVWMQGRSWRLLALSTAAYLGFCLFMPFQLPFYFDSGLSTGEIALLTTVQGLAAGLGAWMGGQACRRWNTQVATGLGSWCVVAAASGHLLLPPTVLGMVMPAGAIGVATGCLPVGFTQMMYASVGRGSNAIYAALTALLLGGQIGLMALSAGIGSVLERVGIPYPTPMFTAAAVTALAGAWWLTRSLSRTQASR